MYRCPRGLVVLAVSAGLLLMASATRVPAQAVKDQAKKEPLPPVGKLPAPKQVDILTVDKVELKAKFYPSTKGKDAACVLLLHALGDSTTRTPASLGSSPPAPVKIIRVTRCIYKPAMHGSNGLSHS